MKRSLAATAIVGAMVLAGCGDRAPADKATEAGAVASNAAAAPTVEPAARSAATPPASGMTAAPAADGAPAFAVIYPGGTSEGPATLAQNADGPGGIVSFSTEATPAEVIAFYRQRAEAAGLKSTSTMNSGDSMGYGANSAGGRGETLSVVATRVEGEPTSVQLSWTAGR